MKDALSNVNGWVTGLVTIFKERYSVLRFCKHTI